MIVQNIFVDRTKNVMLEIWYNSFRDFLIFHINTKYLLPFYQDGLIPRSGPNSTVNVRTGGDEKSDLASLAADIGVRIVNNVSIFPNYSQLSI